MFATSLTAFRVLPGCPLLRRVSILLALSVVAVLFGGLGATAQNGVRAWGDNLYSQLGDGTAKQSSIPLQTSGLTGSLAVAAGAAHSLAVKSDGTVWAWGYNNWGQLGNGTTTYYSSVPVQVSGLTGVVAVAGGSDYSLALKSDGTVWAWGDNLGNFSLVPVQVSGLTGVIAVASGYRHSLAVKSDGTVWAWGANTAGQLGNGTFINSPVPVQVSNLTGVIAVASGTNHSLAVKSDGTVWAWGENYDGQLGNGMSGYPNSSNVPVQTIGLTGVIAVAGGWGHSLAVKSDGTVWAWGDNEYGQLGNGATTYFSSVPVQTSGLTGVVAIAGGAFHSLALKSDGTVWAWGDNYWGQLGNGTFSTTYPYGSSIPVQTSGLTGVVAVAGGIWHSLAVKSDGTVWAWGDNTAGQLGEGTPVGHVTPVATNGIADVISIAGGDQHSLALKSDGTVWAWGDNEQGQLGDGTSSSSNMPVQVSGLTGLVAVAGGIYHSLAVKSDGTVWAWGGNYSGQLGDGTSGNVRTVPVQTSGLTGVIAVAGGSWHSLAVKSDGTVWAWGANNYGQLGNGTTSDFSNVPVQTSGLTGVVAVAGGNGYSLALQSDGTVWTWGDNNWGQLGNGTNGNFSSVPVQVSGLTGVIAIAGGGGHSLAVKSDGTVWAWGDNYRGQLGNGTTTYFSSVPVQVSGLTGVVAVASGGAHSLAVKSDGTGWGWGDNYYGQLGNGTYASSNVPVQTSGLTGGIAVAGGAYHSLALVSQTQVSLSALALDPPVVPGCLNTTGTVSLNAPAPTDTTILLTCLNPAASVPASLTIPEGATSQTFSITTSPVTTVTTGDIQAMLNGQTTSASLTVRPIGVKLLAVSPDHVTGGSLAIGVVILECEAAPGDITVTLTSSDPTIANPTMTSIVIPAGSVVATFPILTSSVSTARTVTITATANGVSANASLMVTP